MSALRKFVEIMEKDEKRKEKKRKKEKGKDI